MYNAAERADGKKGAVKPSAQGWVMCRPVSFLCAFPKAISNQVWNKHVYLSCVDTKHEELENQVA